MALHPFRDFMVIASNGLKSLRVKQDERLVEEVFIFDAEVIRDTVRVISDNVNVSRFKKITLIATSTLDATVNIGFMVDGTDLHVWNGADFVRINDWTDNSVKIEPENLFSHILNSKWKFLDYPFRRFRLTARCDSAPTTGTLTIKMIGVLN